MLPSLPFELLDLVSFYLPNRDIKSLRLTCRQLGTAVRVRMHRVFISPNPINLRVFRAIADNDTFRKGVTEIIWDDARLIECPETDDVWPSADSPNREDMIVDPENGCPAWAIQECQENLERLRMRKGKDVDRSDHIARAKQVAALLPLKTSFQYYQNLLQQQEEVRFRQADRDTFIYGLKRFPALRRVTITPAAHGWIFAPLYETPMIRAFPRGFNYPIPRGWPTSGDAEQPHYGHPWEDEAEKLKWRGFRIVLHELASQEHNVSELLLDTNYLPTGLNAGILTQSSGEYKHLTALLRRSGFRRLDLALLTGGQENEGGWPCFRNGYLHRALSEASEMQHFTLSVSVGVDTLDDAIQPPGTDPRIHYIPLQTVFPVDKWSKLRHFGLSRFPVVQSDLIALLAALPETLRSVELSFLRFLCDEGSWHGLLIDMRDKVRWHERVATARPKIKIALELHCPKVGFGIWVDNEAAAVLYENGRNPFDGIGLDSVSNGAGMVRDSFEPEHERPNVYPHQLQRMGYEKRNAYTDLF